MANRRSVHGVRRDDDRRISAVPSLFTDETSRIRYTAVTCDPDDFIQSGCNLRHYGEDTELFIGITMCDESEVLFSRTINSIMKNVAHLCSLDGSKTWDDNGWNKVVICIIADGRNEVNKQTLQLLSKMGCYREDIAKDTVNGGPVTAHVFERTLGFGPDTGEPTGDVQLPIRIVFCLKERNEKKLNSHRWFFNAFCPLINPKVCILLDAGTEPRSTSIYELWKCFDDNSHVGGACGEIVPAGLLANVLAPVKNFGRRFSNIFNKPVEINASDCISFLPGAFSAYRYEAILDNSYGPRPLTMYLMDEGAHGGIVRAGSSDRDVQLTLFLEIVTKKGKKGKTWALRQVKSAKASILKETG